MERVAIYMRVSTLAQVQEGESIPAQRAALRGYIDAHDNMIFAGEYLDDGITGTKDTRPELQRMISDAKAGKIDMILVTKMDRLHRSLRNFLNMQDTLDKCHCNWLAIWEPMYDTSTPQGRMVINTMMNLAQFEAENTGSRIRQVQAYKVTSGEVISGSTPPGYSIVNKRLVPNEDASVIQQIFRTYSISGNLAQTVRMFADHPRVPNAKPAFKQMLQNTTYIGEKRGNPNFCEPLVSRDLFDDVQRKLSINVKASQKQTYIFSGLIRCAECGSAFGSNTRRKRRANGSLYPVHQYRCPKHFQGDSRACPNTKVVMESALENYLLANIKDEINNEIRETELREAPIRDNTARIQSLERKLSRLKELFINELIDLDEYKSDKQSLEAEITSLRTQTPPERRDLTALKNFLNEDISAIYDTLTPEGKRYMWRSIIKEIRFGLDRKYHIFFV